MSTGKFKKKRCGLIMPISDFDGCLASHWDDVFSVVKEALSVTEFSVELVSQSDEIGVIQKRIVQNIYDNEIVVCDVSGKNPNVMFELGMRLAFDKPAIIIKDDKTNYSFDTSSIEHLEYPRDLHYHSIQLFKSRLKEKVVATFEASKRPEYTTFLKHFGHFVVAEIEEKKVGKEDYILEAILELGNDLRRLTRPTYIRKNENLKHDVGPMLLYIDRTNHDDKVEYVRNYWERRREGFSLSDLHDPKSPFFTKMLQSYVNHHYLDQYYDGDRVRESLLKAALVIS